MIQIQRILVPVDFSMDSRDAALYGAELSRERNGRLYLLHVIDESILEAIRQVSLKGYKGDFLNALRKIVQDRENDLRRIVSDSAYENLEVEFLVVKGDPSEQIINSAKELSIDLLILGCHGREVTASTPVGSVAQSVINLAPCPVLLVRPIVHDFPDDDHRRV
jgi:universal stress protein A